MDRLGGKLVNSFTDEVTHVVAIPIQPESDNDNDNDIHNDNDTRNNNTNSAPLTKRTIKYACAVLSGIWIVSYNCE